MVEALSVGILTIVVGILLHLLIMNLYGNHDLNNLLIYGLHLLVIGILVHLLCEYTGINKWYCNNGSACKA